ncbi:hypothetical protein DFH06DRAFT_1432630 [Mycena polygramma]|nr:hypothetical protein DFH06DRAFT_1432630 [Mycena polygramma]
MEAPDFDVLRRQIALRSARPQTGEGTPTRRRGGVQGAPGYETRKAQHTRDDEPLHPTVRFIGSKEEEEVYFNRFKPAPTSVATIPHVKEDAVDVEGSFGRGLIKQTPAAPPAVPQVIGSEELIQHPDSETIWLSLAESHAAPMELSKDNGCASRPPLRSKRQKRTDNESVRREPSFSKSASPARLLISACDDGDGDGASPAIFDGGTPSRSDDKMQMHDEGGRRAAYSVFESYARPKELPMAERHVCLKGKRDVETLRDWADGRDRERE